MAICLNLLGLMETQIFSKVSEIPCFRNIGGLIENTESRNFSAVLCFDNTY